MCYELIAMGYSQIIAGEWPNGGPIKASYFGHVTGNQPITDQNFYINTDLEVDDGFFVVPENRVEVPHDKTRLRPVLVHLMQLSVI